MLSGHTHTQRVLAFIKIEVNLYTVGGRLLVTLCAKPFTMGVDLIAAATPYLEPDMKVENILNEDRFIGYFESMGELNVDTGARLHLILGRKSKYDDGLDTFLVEARRICRGASESIFRPLPEAV